MKKITLMICLFGFICISKAQDITFNKQGNAKWYYEYNNGTTFSGNIIVKNGAILSLRCGVYKFKPGKKITVELGGKLEINNAILTQENDNNSGDLNNLNHTNDWSGIEVFGDENYNNNLLNDCPTSFSCTNRPNYQDYVYDASTIYQGSIIMYKSTIRYSNTGVTMGKMFNNLQSSDNGGGILHALDCKFQNNYYSHIRFSYYRNKLNYSIIKNCQFTMRQTLNGTIPSLNWYHIDIRAENNSFRYAFENNVFDIYNPINNFYSIWQNGYMKITNCNFKNYMICITNVNPFNNGGILANNTNIFYKNNFDQNVISIYNNSNRTIIRDNTFKPCTYTRSDLGFSPFIPLANYATEANVCIYNDRALNVKIQGNKQIRVGTAMRLSRADAFLVNNYTTLNGTEISNNTINGIQLSFRTISDNRGIQYGCNTMRTHYRDITNDETAVLSTQGSAAYPCRNVFTKTTNTSLFNIENLNATNYSNSQKLKYYYLGSAISSNTYNPDKYTNNTVDPKNSSNDKECPQKVGILDISDGCKKTLLIDNGGGIRGYGQLKDRMISLTNNGISESEKDEYNHTIIEYDIEMSLKVDYWLLGSVENGYNALDSIIPFLITHNTMNSKLILAEFYLGNNQDSISFAILNQLHTDYPNEKLIDNYLEYYDLLSDYKSNNYSLSWLQNNETVLESVRDSFGFFSTSARALLEHLYLTDSNHSNYGNTERFAELPDIIDENFEDDLDSTENIVIYPNPFDNDLNVEIENLMNTQREFNIVMKDFNGSEIFNDDLIIEANSSDIFNEDMSVLEAGYYIVYIYENGILLNLKLVVKY